MRAHAEAVGDRLEVFLLFVNAVAAAPPPGLMDERSVGRIHEADDAVIDADRHVGGEVGESCIYSLELLDLRGWLGSFFGLGETRARRAGIRYVDPDKTVLLFAGIAAGVDAVDFQVLVSGERGDELALAVVGVERASRGRGTRYFLRRTCRHGAACRDGDRRRAARRDGRRGRVQ